MPARLFLLGSGYLVSFKNVHIIPAISKQSKIQVYRNNPINYALNTNNLNFYELFKH